MDSGTITTRDFLRQWFSENEIAAGLQFLADVAEQARRVLERMFVWEIEIVARLDKVPSTPGYEAMLIERGQHPLVARWFSYWLVDAAKDAANEARIQRTVVDAVRFLAKALSDKIGTDCTRHPSGAARPNSK
jgi:hypothetical protein